MAKKVRCRDCKNSVHWALPERVGENNDEYAKHICNVANNSILCGETMRAKRIDHEQFCKKYQEKNVYDTKYDEQYRRELVELEEEIKEYEQQKNQSGNEVESMENDLPTRGSVLKLIEDIKQNPEIPKNYGTLLDIMRAVETMPAAYDVDKVVEELEGLLTIAEENSAKYDQAGSLYLMDMYGTMARAYKNGIRIVKSGRNG